MNTETIAHLSCLYNSKGDIDRILNDLNEKVLRIFWHYVVSANPDYEVKHDFKYASDLTEYIMSKIWAFMFQSACYPETHQEATNIVEDIKNLKIKVEGADHLISQLFFDNNVSMILLKK